jgi:hypothetical protein
LAELDEDEEELLDRGAERMLEPEDDGAEARGALRGGADRMPEEEEPYDLGAARYVEEPPDGREGLRGTMPERLDPALPEGAERGTTTGYLRELPLRDE